MWKIRSLILLGCLVSLSVTAQIYQGHVTDKTNNKALEIVIVCLLRADSTNLDFTYTDVDGHFTIQTPEGKEVPSYISFNLLGYEHQIIPIKEEQTTFNIALAQKEFKLREVKITPERIIRRGDTLTYKVSGFKMPQDKQIIDVIKRLPGIEVSAEGAISYEGKSINAFYIEGMDLLGGQYTIASNNLGAKKVKEVQVLTNHQKVKALKGLKFSDQAALNLVLEEDAKSHFMVTMDIEGGYGDGKRSKLLWNNRLLGMLFGRKQQNLSMYKNTNMGTQIELEFLDHIERSNTRNNEEKGILSIGGKASDLQENRTLFNNAHVLTFNQLWKPDKATDWRMKLNYLHDEQKQSSASSITYFLPEEERVVTEVEQLNNKQDKVSAELTYTKNDSHNYLKNTFKGNMVFANGNRALTTNQSPLSQNTDLKEQRLHDTFEWVSRKERSVFSLYSENLYDKLPQRMWVTSGLYSDILNEGKPYEGWVQQVNLQSFRSHTYTYFQHRLWRILIRYKAGIEWHNQWLDSDLNLNQEEGWNVADKRFSNHLRISDCDLYVEPSLSFIQDAWKIELLYRIAYRRLQIHTSLPTQSNESESHLLPEPRLTISWQPNGLWTLSTTASYNNRFGDIHELYGGYIFTSYRSASLYGKQISRQRTGSLRGNISYANPVTGWFFTGTGSYSFNLRNLLYERSMNSILEERKAIYQPTRGTQWNLSLRNTKTFAFWKSSITFTPSYLSSTSAQKIQGELLSVRSDMGLMDFSLSTQPIRYLSFDWNSNYQYMRMRSSLPSASTNQWRHRLQCNILPSDKWRITWSNEFYHNNDQATRNTLFSDLSVEHSSPTFDIALTARNLFNRNTYQRIYMSDMTESFYSYDLRPREITLLISFAF